MEEESKQVNQEPKQSNHNSNNSSKNLIEESNNVIKKSFSDNFRNTKNETFEAIKKVLTQLILRSSDEIILNKKLAQILTYIKCLLSLNENDFYFYSVENYLNMQKQLRIYNEEIEKFKFKNQKNFGNLNEPLTMLLNKENRKIKLKENDFKLKEMKYLTLLSEQANQIKDYQFKLFGSENLLNEQEKKMEVKCRIYPYIYNEEERKKLNEVKKFGRFNPKWHKENNDTNDQTQDEKKPMSNTNKRKNRTIYNSFSNSPGKINPSKTYYSRKDFPPKNPLIDFNKKPYGFDKIEIQKKSNKLSQGFNEIRQIVVKSPEFRLLKPFNYKK